MGKMGSGRLWAQYRVGLHPTDGARQSVSSAAPCMALIPWTRTHEGSVSPQRWEHVFRASPEPVKGLSPFGSVHACHVAPVSNPASPRHPPQHS